MAYATAAEVKTYAGVSGSGDDDLLTALIARAQAAIETITHRVFEASADSTRYLDAIRQVSGDILWLDRDLCQITSVTVEADADDGGDALTLNTHYLTRPRNDTPYYALRMMNNSDYSWSYEDDPENGIKIVGRWSYSVTPPNDIKHACIRLAAYYYKQKDAQVFDTTALPEQGVISVPQGIPRDVKLILTPYIRAL